MNKQAYFLPFIAVGAFASLVFCKEKTSYSNIDPVNDVQERSAAQNYSDYCASCHGEKMDMFVARNWKQGSELNDLIHGIKNG